MDYLGLALFAEGQTDHRFLQPLLVRLCEDLCLQHANRPVEVAPVLELHSPTHSEGTPREDRIVLAAAESAAAWRLLFVHTDGEGDPQAAYAQRVRPAADRVRTRLGNERAVVGVVPVRETESWILADGDALRVAFGTTLLDQDMGLPNPLHLTEGIRDPKAALRQAHRATNPTRTRARTGAAVFLSIIGEQISLPKLRHLPSFVVMETDLLGALRAMGLLR